MGSLTNFYKRVVSKARPEARLRALLILALLLVCSLGINMLLARRVSKLTTLVSRMKSESRLVAGDKVPAITARDPEGRTAVLDYAGTDLPTVLFVITPKCGWCTKNIMNMRTLAASASDRYRFVGLSLESDKLVDYVTRNQLEFPVYTDLPLVPMKQYKLGGTPQTTRFRTPEISGQVRWIDTQAVPLTVENGVVTSVLTVSRPLSRRPWRTPAQGRRPDIAMPPVPLAQAVHSRHRLCAPGESAATLATLEAQWAAPPVLLPSTPIG